MTRRATGAARLARDTVAPAALYLVIYAVMNPHAWHGFSDHFLLDTGDGYQNVWNVWWLHHSLVDLHTNPYFTHLLHWPEGVTLVPQTMSPINGLVGIVLQGVGLGLAATVNVIVVASFVGTGVTTYWLLRYLRASRSAALLGGLLFAFSSFHTAHAIGHLQLVSLEFVPLFVLAWLRYLDGPSHRRAVAAAAALFAVILCDYYYAFYCLGIAVLLLAGTLVGARRRERAAPPWGTLATFAGAAALTSGVLLGALLLTNHRDPLLGAHHAVYYGLDPMALVIPGGGSYWSSLTTGYWHRLLTVSVSETSVYLGSVLLVGLVSGWIMRRRKAVHTDGVWWVILGGFGVLALGPRLHFDGVLYRSIPMPYAVFERVVPGFKLSGMPVRMTVVVLLAAVVIVTDVVTALQERLRSPRARWLLAGALAVLSIVELYPRPVPRTPTAYPAYVAALRRLPHDAGVLDLGATRPSAALYAETGYGMPMAFGYVTRTPASVDRNDRAIAAALHAGEYGTLCAKFKLRYLVSRHPRSGLVAVFRGAGPDRVWIYDLRQHTGCATSS